MKKIFLHIGAGKTGSSALQNWLYKNHQALKEEGLYYPIFSQKITDEYQITSGNGVYFIQALRQGKLQKLLKTFTNESENLLFSSEVFQNLTDTELESLKSIIKEYNYDMNIILYVRDLYDMVYSSYLQLIKRHVYFQDFEYLCQNIETVQQFDVLYKYEKIFDKIEVVHYDSHIGEGIEKPLYKILNLSIKSLKPMKKTKVNRSLDVFESELLKKVNRFLVEDLDIKDEKICTKLSDDLIYANPEKKTEIFYSYKVFSILNERFLKDINYINKKYLLNENKLNVFEKKDKLIIKEVPKITQEFMIVVRSILGYFSHYEEFDSNKGGQSTDIIGVLYGRAKELENTNIEKSIQILKTAKILRPDGILLNKTLNEMEYKLKMNLEG